MKLQYLFLVILLLPTLIAEPILLNEINISTQAQKNTIQEIPIEYFTQETGRIIFHIEDSELSEYMYFKNNEKSYVLNIDEINTNDKEQIILIVNLDPVVENKEYTQIIKISGDQKAEINIVIHVVDKIPFQFTPITAILLMVASFVVFWVILFLLTK